MLKSTCAAALVITVCAQSALAGSIVELESDGEAVNNSIATAQRLDPGLFDDTPDPNVYLGPGFINGSITGRVGENGDVDFYCFVLGTDATVRLDIDTLVSSDGQDTMLWLFDGTGTLIAGSDDHAGDPGSSSGLDSFIGDLVLSAGSYYVAVSDYYNAPVVFDGYYYYEGGPEGGPPQGPYYGPDGPYYYGPDLGPRGFDPDRTVVSSYPLSYGGYRLYVAAGDYGNSAFAYGGPQDGNVGDPGVEAYTLHITTDGFMIAAAPEPATVALFGLGLLGLVGVVRRRRRTA